MERQAPMRDDALIKLAPGRVRRIENLLAQRKVYVPRNEIIVTAVQLLAAYWFDNDSQLVGRENLQEARELHNQGKTVIMVRNHLSDIDHGIASSLLIRNGFTDLQTISVLAAGLKMDERPDTKIASHCENRIRIDTPFDKKAVESALNEINVGSYSPEEVETLKNLEKDYTALGFKALKEILKRIHRQRMILVLYPEATRSKTGFLQQAQAMTAPWFELLARANETFMLPMAIEGGEQKAPPHGRLRIRGRISPRVAAGEPVEVRKILKFAGESTNRDQMIVDCAMAHVAVLLSPKYILPEDLNKALSIKRSFDDFKWAA